MQNLTSLSSDDTLKFGNAVHDLELWIRRREWMWKRKVFLSESVGRGRRFLKTHYTTTTHSKWRGEAEKWIRIMALSAQIFSHLADRRASMDSTADRRIRTGMNQLVRGGANSVARVFRTSSNSKHGSGISMYVVGQIENGHLKQAFNWFRASLN